MKGTRSRSRRATLFGPGLAALLVMSAPVLAVTVHTWVDSAGVRHFADTPPADAQPSQEITVDDGPPAAPGVEDYYSIANQWQRLRAERDAQAAQALERERDAAAERDSQTPAPAPPAPEPRYPAYYARPFYPWPQPPGGPRGPDGPPSPRNAHVNTSPPVWPRER